MLYTRSSNAVEMVKKMGPNLRELALAARGSQDAVSRNLERAFFTIPVKVASKRSAYRDQVVEVWVGGRPQLERLEVDVVERLVVEAERHVARLDQLVHGQHRVVRLHHHLGDLLVGMRKGNQVARLSRIQNGFI